MSRPTGSLHLEPMGNGVAEITNLNVSAPFQRQGIGSLLVQTAVQAASRMGASRIVLEARPSDNSISSSALLNMYARLGFSVTGRSSRGSPVMQRMTGAPQRLTHQPVQRPALSSPTINLKKLAVPVSHWLPVPAIRRIPAPAPIVQRAQKQVNVPAYQQNKSNTCWAATARMTHEAYSGQHYNTEGAFVNAEASGKARTKWAQNKVADVNEAIGDKAQTNNYLSTSDTSGSYSKSVFTKELNKDQPIILNVNGNHYVTVTGKRKNGQDWELEIVDPADGVKRWVATHPSGNKITHIENIVGGGWYTLSVAYYTAP